MEFYGECEFIIEPRLLCFVVLFICTTLIVAVLCKTSVLTLQYGAKKKHKKKMKKNENK